MVRLGGKKIRPRADRGRMIVKHLIAAPEAETAPVPSICRR